jgi:hypothetical protein
MKKIKLPEKYAGIWIDQEQALIIHLSNNIEPVMEKITSGVESRIRIKGESKVSARFGQSYIDDQEKKQRRQRQQRSRYFKKIIKLISQDDYLYLIGPGRGKEELKNAMKKIKDIKIRIIKMEPADKLTENQLIERVTAFYCSNDFRKSKKIILKEIRESVS